MTTVPDFPFTLSGETWASIAGKPGYFISDLGRLASYREPSVGARGRKSAGWTRLLTTKPGASGYVRYAFYGGVTPYIHHLVAAAFLPDAPSADHEITFRDEDVTNCRADNLIWRTPSQRIEAQRAAGTYDINKRINHVTLTEDDVRDIRVALRDGYRQSDLARKYGVKPNAIWQLKEGLTWKHVA